VNKGGQDARRLERRAHVEKPSDRSGTDDGDKESDRSSNGSSFDLERDMGNGCGRTFEY
jgi:hypothetical protein